MDPPCALWLLPSIDSFFFLYFIFKLLSGVQMPALLYSVRDLVQRVILSLKPSFLLSSLFHLSLLSSLPLPHPFLVLLVLVRAPLQLINCCDMILANIKIIVNNFPMAWYIFREIVEAMQDTDAGIPLDSHMCSKDNKAHKLCFTGRTCFA